MRLCTCALTLSVLSLLAIGCAVEPDGEPAGDLNRREQGLTEISLDARALLDASITRVTLEASGQSQELTLNPNTNTYDGALLLPAGSHSLLAQAYAGPQLVGASNPMTVEVQPGQVLRVLIAHPRSAGLGAAAVRPDPRLGRGPGEHPGDRAGLVRVLDPRARR